MNEFIIFNITGLVRDSTSCPEEFTHCGFSEFLRAGSFRGVKQMHPEAYDGEALHFDCGGSYTNLHRG